MTGAERRAVVTGAAGAIGGATARALATAGWQVLATDLAEPAGGADLAWHCGDLRDAAFRARLAERAGPVDALVIAHGAVRTEPVEALDEDAVAGLMAVNFAAPLFTALAFRPCLSRGSCVIFVGSVAGLKAVPLHLAYGASKAALHSAAASLAVAFAPEGIRVNTLCPGLIASPQTDRADAELAAITGEAPAEVAARRERGVPVGRAGSPEEVAAAVVALLGEGMSYVTGARLLVAGGSLAGEA